MQNGWTKMIASAVVTLIDNACRLKSTIAEIASRPRIELGEFNELSRKIPLTIEADRQSEVESATQWLQQLAAVSFVDVGFVHFEDADHLPPPGDPKTTIDKS